MTKEELKEKLENELTKKIRKRRIIIGSVFIVFLVIGILFIVLRESSKEIIIHGDIFKWEQVVYKHDYLFFILTGFLGAVFAFCVLFGDFLGSRFETTKVNGHYLTIYRGIFESIVYINGEEKERLVITNFSNVIETKLPDGVKVIIAFSRSVLFTAHISFSDNNKSIEI